MRRIKKGKRHLAVALSILLAFGGLPAAAFAEGQPIKDGGRCKHHPEHTADCGYTEGQPCGHEHSEDCHTGGLVCSYDGTAEATASVSDAGHIHTWECYAPDCPHGHGEHDGICGYMEAQPCQYLCGLCEKTESGPEQKPGEGTELPPAGGVPVKTITSWTFVGDDNLNEGELPLPGVSMEQQMNFEAVVSMLPTGLSAEIEGETETVLIDITGWSCPEYVRDENGSKVNEDADGKESGLGHWPITGEYMFTAELPDSYACDPIPTVKVLLGGAELYDSTVVGDFLITGDRNKYTFAEDTIDGVSFGNVLTIKDKADLVIENVDPETPTSDRIKVEEGTNVSITLAGVNIARVMLDPHSPFDMTGATVNLTLVKGCENFLKSESKTGLIVQEGAVLIIGGQGSLEVESESQTGIGGVQGKSGGTIIIGGEAKVTATGDEGAGIGGGIEGNGGKITIQENADVTAKSRLGAGIGGGSGSPASPSGGSGGTIIIEHMAKVRATSEKGAGIGGGQGGQGTEGVIGGQGGSGGEGGSITISGSAEVEAVSENGAGIGGGKGGQGVKGAQGGQGGSGGEVTLSGVVKVTARGGAGIGGGQGGPGSGGGDGGNGGNVFIKEGAKVTAESVGGGAGIGGGPVDTKGKGGNGGNVEISGEETIVIARGEFDVGGSIGAEGPMGSGGTLRVTDRARLELIGRGTNAAWAYNNCTVVDQGESTEYTKNGKPFAYPTLSLTISPEIPPMYPDKVTLTATLLGASEEFGGNEGKTVSFSLTGFQTSIVKEVTNINGTATCTFTELSPGTYSFDARFAGDDDNKEAAAQPIEHYIVTHGIQVPLSVSLDSTYTYGDGTFGLSISGGSGIGAVKYQSSDTSVASVTGDQVTIQGAGTFTISVTKAGDSNYGETSATSGIVTVNPATPDVSLTAAGGTDISDPVVLTATVSAVKAGATPAGTVTFKEGDTILAEDVELDGSGRADLTVSSLASGSHTYTAVYSGQSRFYNGADAECTVDVAPRNISNVAVSVTGSRVYTGSQIQPAFEVKDGNAAITTGDYICSYGPNVDAGVDTGSIILTGRRNYTGTKEVRFQIERRPLDGAAITLEAASYTYKGGAIRPAVTKVVVDGITVPASAFDVGYANNRTVGTATVTVTAKAGGNFSGAASTTFDIIKFGGSSGGGGGSSDGGEGGSSSGGSAAAAPKNTYTSAGSQVSQPLSRSDLQRLADAGKSLTIQSGTASMKFGLAALKAILAAVPATAGDIDFTAVPADISAFPDAAALVGTRPVYSFTISYRDSKGSAIPVYVDFPAGSASVSLGYAPVENEATGSLFMVYVDGQGTVSWLDRSSYKGDEAGEGALGNTGGKVLADVPHFSVYGVAYKAPAQVFADIAHHWAKADIEFVSVRGLLPGMGETEFSPDTAMTRGMFAAALGQLAGVNPDSYQSRSFTDVKADAYYAAYVEWVAQTGIMEGTGQGSFSPDAAVTREQMAVLLANYAGQMGYPLPAPLAAVTFEDSGKISAWAAEAAAAMQRAGIMRGRDENRFDPQANATRAEASAVLRRFVEVAIDPATAQGWVRNDSGRWHYIDENGIMAVNTKIDGYDIGPDGTRKEN